METKIKSVMSTRKVILGESFYHVTQRAPGRELLFLEDRDYLRFLHLLKKTAKNFSLDILCFALLTNHLHILLKTKERNLDKAMKHLFQSYALGFNAKYERKGHVFCGVYGAVLVKADAQLIVTSLYIHLNPYKAHLTDNMFKYRWFSLDPYIKRIKTNTIKFKFILSIFDKDISKAQEQYRDLMASVKKIKYKNILKDNNAVKNFFEYFARWSKGKTLVPFRKSDINSFLDLEKKLNETKFKKRVNKPADKKAILYLIEQLHAQGYSYEEIASRIGCSRMSVYRLVKESGVRV